MKYDFEVSTPIFPTHDFKDCGFKTNKHIFSKQGMIPLTFYYAQLLLCGACGANFEKLNPQPQLK